MLVVVPRRTGMTSVVERSECDNWQLASSTRCVCCRSETDALECLLERSLMVGRQGDCHPCFLAIAVPKM